MKSTTSCMSDNTATNNAVTDSNTNSNSTAATTASSIGAPTEAYLMNFGSNEKDAPLLIYFPGLDETGKDLISLEMNSFKQDFDVRGLIIPADDLDDWDRLATAAIALIRHEVSNMPAGTPVCLCAESFGGCLALKVLEAAPDLFDRVILVNPASSFNRVPWLNLGTQLMPLVPEIFFNQSLNGLSDGLVFFLASLDRISVEAKQALAKSTSAAPKETLVKRLNLMNRFSVDEGRLQRVRCPVLLIGSKGDRILPSVEEAHRLNQIFPNSQTLILPHSGHACLAEKDVDLDQIMRDRHIMPLRSPAASL